jgi:hypothetical protein
MTDNKKRCSNKELATALRSTASALEHGRYATAARKLHVILPVLVNIVTIENDLAWMKVASQVVLPKSTK